MARNIGNFNATQIVTSKSNPKGIYSVTTEFPKVFESGDGVDIEANMKTAKSAHYDQLSKNYANTNEQLLRVCIGNVPATEPEEPIEE